ncbi:MAG TPA: thioesterase [Kiritimatiellia bacterium]|nr:thioesterase [Kiritimatiellia bacterium]
MDCPVPLHVHDERFCVRAYESGVNNQVTLQALCNYLQEAAGNHARTLGVGIHALQSAGFTWMLARLHLEISRYAAWRETIRLRTWPSGVRGRLTALRDFQMVDETGATLLRGVSEWLYVDTAAQRIVRLPPSFALLAPEGTPRATAMEPPDKLPDIVTPEWSTAIIVRHSDHDFNDHVNNVHYAAWALECLPDTWRAQRRMGRIDIAFRAAARWGDTVTSEAARETAGCDATLIHRIRRDADGAVLAQARTCWR